MTFSLAPVSLLAVLLPGASAPAPLRDQLGRSGGLHDHRGRPVAALVVSAARLRSLKGWELELRKRCPGLVFLRVMDVPPQPPVSFEHVARRLRGRVPDEAPVLIDLTGSWARAYQLDTREVNLLLFDREGRPAGRVRGRKSPQLLRQAQDAARAVSGCSTEPMP